MAGDDEIHDAPTLNTPTALERPSARPSQPALRPSQSRYENRNEIGRGGMGRVVEATDTLLDRVVAVKEALTDDAELLRRFRREVKITARLEHPSIVPVYDAGIVDDQPYYVMRRVTGRPLSELIRAAPTLEERLALVPNLLAAAQAIAHAHQRGIIHRDIKPSNILVGELGETVVIDWGLAKVVGEPDDEVATGDHDAGTSLRTRVGAVFGTPGFMAPDQLRGDPTGPQGDVYALGACLYNLLAGAPPHYDDDSTRMMKLAAKGPPERIARVVPGVPAELSTIVDTALDYNTEKRYANAGAFAEELKRFLAGQLVASHQYSTWERLVRYVRKHRGAVAIGSAATVIVVVIGVFAVSRVVAERDRADAQARDATEQRHSAEAARAMADERAEELLLSRARTLVETNPTAAVASLKQMPARRRTAEVRAVVDEARMRGVSWAMQGPTETTTSAELDPSGLRLAHVTIDGVAHVWDLDARRLVFEVPTAGRGRHTYFVHGGSLLIVGRGDQSRIFDVNGTERPSEIPPYESAVIDDLGDTLAAIDPQGRAERRDLVHNTATVLAEGAIDTFISSDGEWIGVRTQTATQIFDRSGKVIVQRTHHSKNSGRLTFGPGRAAMIDDGGIYEAPLTPNATWTQVLAPVAKDVIPIWVDYLNDHLYGLYSDTQVMVDSRARGVGMHPVARLLYLSTGNVHFGDKELALGNDGRKVTFVDGVRIGAIQLPFALREARLLGRKGLKKLVAIGDGAIVVVDLGWMSTEARVPGHLTGVWLDDHTLIASNSWHYDFLLYDINTGESTTLAELGPTMRLTDVSFTRHEAAIVEELDRSRLWIAKAGEKQWRLALDDPFEETRLLEDGLVFSINNIVYDANGRKELTRTDGPVKILVSLGKDRFAAVTEREMVRGSLGAKVFERIALPPGMPVSWATVFDDDLHLARGQSLLRWHGNELVEVTHYSTPILMVHSTAVGLIVRVTDGSTFFLDRDKKETRLATVRGAVLINPHRVVVPGPFNYEVIELPSLTRWSLPIITGHSDTHLEISPDGEHLLESGIEGRLWIYHLPATDEDIATALASTNFVEDNNGVLMWPWQAK